jgi:hypothetical protein
LRDPFYQSYQEIRQNLSGAADPFLFKYLSFSGKGLNCSNHPCPWIMVIGTTMMAAANRIWMIPPPA